MLVALFNVVKVESVPLNFEHFLRERARRCTFARGAAGGLTFEHMIEQWESSRRSGTTASRPGAVPGGAPAGAVLIDLTVLFPRQPHRDGRYHPHGLQMHKVVEGTLSCWGVCEQGDWWGLVTYEIAYGSRRKTVTHWVPGWTLRRKTTA